jgi:hypothetical protein
MTALHALTWFAQVFVSEHCTQVWHVVMLAAPTSHVSFMAGAPVQPDPAAAPLQVV